MLNSKMYYGYELIQTIGKWSIVAAKESMVYPLLRRLQKDGYLESEWKDSMEGRVK